MIEKCNPSHPDKIADRIAGALVDLAYKKKDNPKIAVELTIGHGVCHIFLETSVKFEDSEILEIVNRITKTKGDEMVVMVTAKSQDVRLANNQKRTIKCGDNGIFKGAPLTKEQKDISAISHSIYEQYATDGKYILDGQKLIVCQSRAKNKELEKFLEKMPVCKDLDMIINPIGEWTGGTNVDTGAVNRKLGSDMADSVTGGGLHGKDLSKADVSVNIYAFLKAQEENKPVEISVAIGDTKVDGRPYKEIVQIAKDYIDKCGGFEKFAEWGLY